MLRVIDIKVINIQKQQQCPHGVLLCYLGPKVVKIADRSFEWAYCPRVVNTFCIGLWMNRDICQKQRSTCIFNGQ